MARNLREVERLRIPGTSIQGWRAVAVGALALYSLLFLILNDRKVEVDFVFFSVKGNELLALVLIAALGFAAGFIVRSRLREPEAAPRKPQAIASAPAPIPEPPAAEASAPAPAPDAGT